MLSPHKLRCPSDAEIDRLGAELGLRGPVQVRLREQPTGLGERDEEVGRHHEVVLATQVEHAVERADLLGLDDFHSGGARRVRNNRSIGSPTTRHRRWSARTRDAPTFHGRGAAQILSTLGAPLLSSCALSRCARRGAPLRDGRRAYARAVTRATSSGRSGRR